MNGNAWMEGGSGRERDVWTERREEIWKGGKEGGRYEGTKRRRKVRNKGEKE
jgi:hypothetical protein